MQTPFTPHFRNASIPLTEVSSEPFVPTYPLPFVGSESAAYYVGDGCQLNYRWHDAFDVFLAVLEVNVADAQQTITIPVSSHLNDVHLVYQLMGTSHIQPVKGTGNPTIQLSEDHRFAAYTPPAETLGIPAHSTLFNHATHTRMAVLDANDTNPPRFAHGQCRAPCGGPACGTAP
ncbi:hypothetical protein [Parapedobacter soli]|uniref:hypothetical protein n=1 Tax=Parapedobacter soli TaxID=416955 RepID=UPI0021C7686B|nr:hypothetical protein [Parapedobacter soli]